MNKYCLTYFLVIGNEKTFDFKDFCESLGFDYDYMQDWTVLEDGERSVEIGRNENYKDDINEMVKETLKDLLGKEEILNELKQKYNLKYCLERVPCILIDKRVKRQKLSLDSVIIDFMSKTGTIDDLDYHLI